MLALTLFAVAMNKMGIIDDDTVKRVVIGVDGLLVVHYGNRMPKAVVPDPLARQATRVAGWSMVASGLVWLGLWAFAPIDVATMGGIGAILAGIAVTFAYCLTLRGRKPA
ncbi:MAG: ammonium transporter [Caulobacterales bacterium 68-7]|nr:MAG: ammonium transporter [Caulobacterales bacterium 68-7]